jgi:dihydrofolate reductase
VRALTADLLAAAPSIPCRRLLGVTDPSENAIAEALNTKPKYVASSTLTEPKWDDTTVLSADVAAAIGELKAKPGRELQVHGIGALIRWLMNHDLVDEINLFTCPVVIGRGTHLFPDTGPDRAFAPIESGETGSGRRVESRTSRAQWPLDSRR